MVHRQVTQHTGFYLYGLHISFPFHLVAGFQFLLGHHLGILEHFAAVCIHITLTYDRTTVFHIATTFAGFFHPFLAITVTVESDRFAEFDVFAQYINDRAYLGLTACYLSIHTLLEGL